MATTRWMTIASGHSLAMQAGKQVFDPLRYRVLVEELPGGGTRTLRIEGRIANVGGRRRRMPQLPGMSPFDHRGHLIALQFGGPDVVENLVPMHGRINMSGTPWAAMESEISALIGDARAEMAVRVEYGNDDPLRPIRLTVRVSTLEHGNKTWHFANFGPYLTSGRRPGG